MAENVSPISAERIIEEILDRSPMAAHVFLRRRMHCVGCPIARFETVAEVCRIYCQQLDDFLAELNAMTWSDTPCFRQSAAISPGSA